MQTHTHRHTGAWLWMKCDSSQSGAIIPWLLSHYCGLIGSALCFQRCSKLLLMKFQPQQKTALHYCGAAIPHLTSTSGNLCLQSAAFLEATKEDLKKKGRKSAGWINEVPSPNDRDAQTERPCVAGRSAGRWDRKSKDEMSGCFPCAQISPMKARRVSAFTFLSSDFQLQSNTVMCDFLP